MTPHKGSEKFVYEKAREWVNSMPPPPMSPRELTHKMYRDSGFDVDMGGVWRSQPHVNVQFTTASIESDFYEYD